MEIEAMQYVCAGLIAFIVATIATQVMNATLLPFIAEMEHFLP